LTSKEPDSSALARVYREAAPWLSVAWQFTGSVLGGVAVGYFIDRQWGLTPWGLVVGGLAGSTLGFVAFLRATSRMNKKP